MNLLKAIDRFYYDLTLNELRLMNENTVYPNITYNSLLYMDLIAYKKDCTVSYLADVLHISKSAVTIKVNELIKQGLVEKNQSQQDRRVHYLKLAPAAAADYKQYDRRLFKAVKLLSEQYDQKQLDTLCEMLQVVSICYTDPID